MKHVANQSQPHTYEDYRIAGALINKYFKRIFSDVDDLDAIVDNMKKKFDLNNQLKKIVEDDKLHLKSQFINLNSDLITDFPKLDESLIKTHITLGTYQLKQALRNLSEHMNENKI